MVIVRDRYATGLRKTTWRPTELFCEQLPLRLKSGPIAADDSRLLVLQRPLFFELFGLRFRDENSLTVFGICTHEYGLPAGLAFRAPLRRFLER